MDMGDCLLWLGSDGKSWAAYLFRTSSGSA
jgi:hypothetical protein